MASRKVKASGMSPTIRVAGVDGCRGGWLIATANADLTNPSLDIATDFQDLLSRTAACKVVMVDIPIGLPDDANPKLCDVEARRLLVGAQSRVFRAPPYQSLKASNPKMMQRIHKEMTGKGTGYPVWGILPKLKDVHHAISPADQAHVFEFHPELAWMRTAGKVLPSKHKPEGITERTKVLRKRFPLIDALFGVKKYPRKMVQEDDILDAFIGLVLASDKLGGSAHRLPADPAEPPRDRAGLRTEIWY